MGGYNKNKTSRWPKYKGRNKPIYKKMVHFTGKKQTNSQKGGPFSDQKKKKNEIFIYNMVIHKVSKNKT